MAWIKNANESTSAKSIFASLLKAGVTLSSCAILFACGGDGGSKSSGAEDVPVREVSTIYDLGACTPDREGDTVYVTAQSIDYLCSNNNWLDITTLPENPDPMQSSSSVIPGNDSESSSSTIDDPLNGGSSSSARASYIEVPTKEQLGTCDASLIGLRALVLADSSYFTCKVNGWAKDETYLGYDIVPTKEELSLCHEGNAKQRILVKKDSVFFKCDSVKWVPETADGYIVKNASILGAAQKGPFKFDSPLTLREVLLHDDALTYTGREYIDEISSNKGDFVIPKVNLVYPYAVLEVRGLWRNEVTGEWSKDSMTLRALTDFTTRTEVNINLLTHLEYDRAVKLVNKGYSVFAAKKQAEYEIMTAFGFATTVEYSEDLKTFVPSTSTNHDVNATLMAISLLFIGDRNEAEIQKAIADFKQDMAGDGEWNDAQTKADMADWAEGFDGGSVRANVKSWNILDIPAYENYLTIYWNNAYELGGCASTRYDVVAQNRNAKSKNYNVHYICKATGWQKATDYEKDTYEWTDGEEGEVRAGKVNQDKFYVYENGAWRASANEIENNLGACVTNRLNEVGKSGNKYYSCKSGGWVLSTALEYDTYQWTAGTDGEVKPGSVISSNHYTYADGAWRATANDMEYEFGACVASRSNEKHIQKGKYYICENKAWKQITAEEYGLGYCTASNSGAVEKLNDVYYICKSGSWVTATVLEYDTYGWKAGTEGEMKPGSVNSSNHYVYEDGAWRATSNDVEYEFGACVASRSNEKHIQNGKYYICENRAWKLITAEEYRLGYCSATNDGVVEKLNDVYYICKSGSWVTATVLEYDTYGKTCLTDGTIVSGEVITSNKYVCDANSFRVANEQEISLDKGCVSYTENEEIRKQISDTQDSIYTCKSSLWAGSVINIVYGTLTDPRDGKTYKTVVIGTQTWMAENLNYEISNSWCYENKEENCEKYGRLYTWAAAKSAVPNGWHLPTNEEWGVLAANVGGMANAGTKLKSKNGWNSGNGTDDYGFAALPAGDRYSGSFTSVGSNAYFWTATEYSSANAYYRYFDTGASMYSSNRNKTGNAFSVRLVKDSE